VPDDLDGVKRYNGQNGDGRGYVFDSCRIDQVSTLERLAIESMMYPCVELHLNPYLFAVLATSKEAGSDFVRPPVPIQRFLPLQQWAQEESGASLAASTTAPRPTRACHIRSVRSGLQDQRNVINGERLQDSKESYFCGCFSFSAFFLLSLFLVVAWGLQSHRSVSGSWTGRYCIVGFCVSFFLFFFIGFFM
jgi:hypothetical protein